MDSFFSISFADSFKELWKLCKAAWDFWAQSVSFSVWLWRNSSICHWVARVAWASKTCSSS